MIDYKLRYDIISIRLRITDIIVSRDDYYESNYDNSYLLPNWCSELS